MRDQTIDESCIRAPNFVYPMLKSKISLKRKHVYTYKIQGAMHGHIDVAMM
jgi:hypothetical protein